MRGAAAPPIVTSARRPSGVTAAVIFALALALGTGACGGAPPVARAPAATAAPPSGAGAPGAAVSKEELEKLATELEAGRLAGWVHGAVPGRGLYVFTWRRPGDFFTFYDFPLVPSTRETAERLASVARHDRVRIKGRYVRNEAPIQHIELVALEVVKAYSADETAPARKPATEISDQLAGKRTLVGKVHAVAEDGHLLVIEHGDAVLPVFVRDPEKASTRSLFRNDKIRLSFEIAKEPSRPTHLWTDPAVATPIEVLERVSERHGRPADVEGLLVRFPESPQIKFDVYAVQVTDADGITREYTLVNQDPHKPDLFQAIRKTCAEAWAARKGEAIDGRNKLVSPVIRVRARGTWNVVARNQANVQILLPSTDALTFAFAAAAPAR